MSKVRLRADERHDRLSDDLLMRIMKEDLIHSEQRVPAVAFLLQ